MRNLRSPFKSTWFLLLATALTCASVAACATEEPDDFGDVDGAGRGDGWSTDSADRLADIPFYFSVPKRAVTVPLDSAAIPFPTLWNKSTDGASLGLRVIAVRQGASLEERKSARRDMATKLGASGVLKDGDIVLTFRPELAGTLAYPHIQMGTTHAGLVYTKDGAAFNVDSPLDNQYVGQFDAPHYAGNGRDDAGTDALHIIRPRVMNDTRRASLRGWLSTLKNNVGRINGQRAQVKFQSDYLVPAYVRHGMTTKQTVTTLGKILLETDKTTKMPMYCSELAWHLIALSACTADQIRAAPAEGASCVDVPFGTLPLVATKTGEVGLAEGPLLALLGMPARSRASRIPAIFASDGGGQLSAGHRAVAEQVGPLMEQLQPLFSARAGGSTPEQTATQAAQLNAQVPANYSPTAFLVTALGNATNRPTDYIATIAFVDDASFEKAKTLAQQPTP